MSRKINEATVEEWKGLLEACDSRPKDVNLVVYCYKDLRKGIDSLASIIVDREDL